MPTTKDWRDLERVKQANVGQLLLKSARLLDERALARVNQSGVSIELRPAHTSLLPHIDREGTRLTELARRLGVTKQAVGQLVSELEGLGMLTRVDDPEDGRAKLVCFTERGIEAIHHGLSVLRGIEGELEQRIGRTRMRELQRTLSEIVDELGKRDGRT